MNYQKLGVGLIVLLYLILLVVSYKLYHTEVLFISLFSATSMIVFSVFGWKTEKEGMLLVWFYGLASGAMMASTALFLFPQSMSSDGFLGGMGIAFGFIVGFALHTFGHLAKHDFSPVNGTVLELTTHSLIAGCVIGMIYETLPTISILLGLAIVSHKGPAGFTLSNELKDSKEPFILVLLPALTLGIGAMGVFPIANGLHPEYHALFFGISSGIFFHIAADFIPRCEAGSKFYQKIDETEDEHKKMDNLRMHAVWSLLIGALLVVGLAIIFGIIIPPS